MKSLRLGLAVTVLLVLLPASPALSAESTALCYGMWNLSFSPGVGTTPTKGTFTTHGETGTFTCVGDVRGHAVTGPGTFGQEGVFEGMCLQGTASSIISVTIPTSAGPEKLSFPTTMTTGPGFGVKFGHSLLGPLTFVFYPVVGDCLTAPVTEIAVVGEGLLKS